jgi:transposase
MADTSKRRARRQFTDEFKASAVRLVLDEGKTVGAAARDLDLTETALRDWVKRAQRRSDARAHRPHDRGPRGVDTTAQRSADSCGGARDISS